MKQRSLVKRLIISFLSFQLCNSAMSDLKLELVQVILRHGARTPSRIEAEHINVTDADLYLPEGYQELTNEGKQQAYKLGTLLRKKYDDFLGAHNPEEYYAITTAYNRTRMSLQLALTGLFPALPEDTWNNTIHQYSSLDVNVLLKPFDAPKYKDLYFKTITNSSEFQEKISKYTKFLETMENRTGIPFKQDILYHAGWTYLAIQYHKAKNLPLPSWYTDDSIFTKLGELYKLGLDSMSLTAQLRRLNGGTLVRRFIENIKNNREAVVPKKIYLYCAHDLTLNAYSKAQNFEAFYLPPYGSAFIMEKYSDSRQFEYLRILAWDAVADNFTPVRIGACEEFCPFEDYLKIVKDNVSTDEDIACLKGEF